MISPLESRFGWLHFFQIGRQRIYAPGCIFLFVTIRSAFDLFLVTSEKKMALPAIVTLIGLKSPIKFCGIGCVCGDSTVLGQVPRLQCHERCAEAWPGLVSVVQARADQSCFDRALPAESNSPAWEARSSCIP